MYRARGDRSRRARRRAARARALDGCELSRATRCPRSVGDSARDAKTDSGSPCAVLFRRDADGGMQEFEAAKAAILKVKPNANVIGNRVDAYPITVTVTTADGKTVWSGRQQGLFRKNGRPAQKEIEDALRKLG